MGILGAVCPSLRVSPALLEPPQPLAPRPRQPRPRVPALFPVQGVSPVLCAPGCVKPGGEKEQERRRNVENVVIRTG